MMTGFCQRKETRLFHIDRHAEIIVPDELYLEDLCYICCRSEAEHRTLMNLLTKEKWSSFVAFVTIIKKPSSLPKDQLVTH